MANARSSSLLKSYRAVVIGAGPSGLAALANLLDCNVHPLLWVDPAFRAGRLSEYPQVPSNTKVGLFLDFASASPTLKHVIEKASLSSARALQAMDPKGTCLLKNVVEMVSELTAGLKQLASDQVHCFQGRVLQVARVQDDNGPAWSVGLNESEQVTTKTVIFATGSHPISPDDSWAPHIRYAPRDRKIEELSLETALNPPALSKSVSYKDVVAVVGGSHSAILCLKNLTELPNRPQRILHYYREKPKYAVQMDGWILYDNTGLKGEAAIWCREVLEKGLVPDLESHFLQNSAVEAQIYQSSMNKVTKIIYAIGFRRNVLPKLLLQGAGGQESEQGLVKYLPKTGKLTANGEPLTGLWGFGIAFPEETVDPHGNRECAVGMWKFMRYLRKSIPQHLVPELVQQEA